MIIRMLNLFCIISILIFSGSLRAQQGSSDVEMGSSASSLLEVQSQVQVGLPTILEKIQLSQTQLKKNRWEDAAATLGEARSDLEKISESLGKFANYQEVSLGLENIGLNLREASFALERRRKADAGREIGEAYKTTKALVDSPVLKLSAAKVSIGAANRKILHKNYATAGSYLGYAIDDLTALQNNPNVDQKEINSLKNDIIITHQQVILGKMQGKSYLGKLYDRASAASANALYQYYDMWTRTDLPWDMY